MVETTDAQVLIIGGGIVGLSLSHALQNLGISSIVFERDAVQSRSQGWALSIHWCKAILENMLGPELAARLPEATVDPKVPQVGLKWDTLDARNGEILYRLPTAGRFIRANRPKLRKLVSEGVDLRMNKVFKEYEILDNGVKATFTDGTTFTGSYLIGCEGAMSQVRKQLIGEAGALNPLLFTSLAVVQTLTNEEAAPIRAVDNLLFQAIQPDTSVFLWHSIQGVDDAKGTADMLTYISYPIPDFKTGLPMNASDEEVIKDMKKHTAGFAEPFKSLVMNIKPGTPVTRIQLRDWISQPWQGGKGRVSLAGDAAGPMTMYRGEGVNHGILDAFWLARTICSIVKGETPDAERALKDYELTLCKRRQFSVPLSRQACIDAHAVPAKDSPLVNVFKIPTDELDRAMELCERGL